MEQADTLQHKAQWRILWYLDPNVFYRAWRGSPSLKVCLWFIGFAHNLFLKHRGLLRLIGHSFVSVSLINFLLKFLILNKFWFICELSSFGVINSLIPLKFLDKHHNSPVWCGHTIVSYELTRPLWTIRKLKHWFIVPSIRKFKFQKREGF